MNVSAFFQAFDIFKICRIFKHRSIHGRSEKNGSRRRRKDRRSKIVSYSARRFRDDVCSRRSHDDGIDILSESDVCYLRRIPDLERIEKRHFARKSFPSRPSDEIERIFSPYDLHRCTEFCELTQKIDRFVCRNTAGNYKKQIFV